MTLPTDSDFQRALTLTSLGPALLAAKGRSSPDCIELRRRAAVLAEGCLSPPQPRSHVQPSAKNTARRTPAEQRPVTASWSGSVAEAGPINADAARRLLRSLSPRQAVDITLTSVGGSPTEAVAIADILAAHGGIVRLKVPKFCHSAGLLVLAAGDERIASKAALFQFHVSAVRGTDTRRLTVSTLRGLADALEERGRMFDQRLAVACGVPRARIEQLASQERALTATEAKAICLLTSVQYLT